MRNFYNEATNHVRQNPAIISGDMMTTKTHVKYKGESVPIIEFYGNFNRTTNTVEYYIRVRDARTGEVLFDRKEVLEP